MVTTEPIVTPVKSGSRRTFANLTSVVGGEALLRLANFATATVIARQGGVAVFGMYATALAYATIAAMLADNGLQVATVREMSSPLEDTSAIFSRAYVAKVALFVPMILALGVVGWTARISSQEWSIAALVTVRTMLQSCCQLHTSALKAIDRMRVIGFIQAAHAVLILTGISYCYASSVPIEDILLVLIAGQSFEMTLEIGWLAYCGFNVKRVNLVECFHLVLRSTPMGASFTIAGTILRLDVVILSIVAGTAAAGVFAAAQTPIVMVYVVSWLFGSVLLPDLTRLADSAIELRRFVREWSRILAYFVFPGTIAAMLLGPSIMRMLFGRGFHQTGTLFLIMIAATPFILLSSLYVNQSIALRNPRMYFGAYVALALVAVGLDFLLVRKWGALGIAVAVLVREFALYLGLRLCALQIPKFSSVVPLIDAPK
jgi:PST family polysaccharide transporter